MKRLMTILMATAFAAACVVGTTTQEEVEVGADATAYEFEIPPNVVVTPEGPGSCTGWAYEHHPEFVVVPTECLAGLDYYYMGDPWEPLQVNLAPDTQAE